MIGTNGDDDDDSDELALSHLVTITTFGESVLGGLTSLTVREVITHCQTMRLSDRHRHQAEAHTEEVEEEEHFLYGNTQLKLKNFRRRKCVCNFEQNEAQKKFRVLSSCSYLAGLVPH